MADLSDVLKYFHKEPAVLEPVVPSHDPDARRRGDRSEVPSDEAILHGDPFGAERDDEKAVYRGYLAGTNHAEDRVGLTALRRPSEAFVEPVLEALGGAWWGRREEEGRVEPLDAEAARRALRAPEGTQALVTASAPVPEDLLTEAVAEDPERARAALRPLLEAADVAFFPESAHDGHDWSFWSADPMRERLTGAFRARPVPEVRRFAIPAAKARSESKFYFDTWHPVDAELPAYVDEV